MSTFTLAADSRWRLALAIVLIVPVLLVAPALRPGVVLSAADGLLDAYLLEDARPEGYTRSNGLLTDSYRQFVPWRSLTSRELLAGRLPFWNPYAYAGSPLLGNGQSAVFDPLALPYLAVPDTPEKASVWVALLRMWVAGIGALLLARRLGVGPPGAALAGIAYACGGFTVVWLLSPHTSSSAWVPWVLLAAHRLAERPRPRTSALLGLAASASVFGGHPEVAFFAAAAAGAYVLARRATDGGDRSALGRRLGWGVAAGLLCVAVTAVHVAPFVETLGQGAAVEGRAERASAASLTHGFQPVNLVSQLFPYVQGRPLRGEVAFWTPDTTFHDLVATYVGVLPFLLAVWQILVAGRRSPTAGLRGIAVVSWAYCVQVPPLGWLALHIPLVGLSPPERVAPVAACAIAVLGGAGLHRALEPAGRSRRLERLVPVLVRVGAGAALAGTILVLAGTRVADLGRVLLDGAAGQALFGHQSGRVLAGLGEALPVYGLRYVLPWSLIVVAAGLVLGAARRGRSWAGWAAVAVVAADLLWLGVGFNPALPEALVFPSTRAIERVRDGAASGRALMLQEGLPASAATRYGIRDVQGYDAIDRWRLGRLLEHAGPFRRFGSLTVADSWVYDLLGVRIVTMRTPRESPRLESSGPIGGGHAYRTRTPLPSVFATETVVQVADPGAAETALSGTDFDPRRVAVIESRGPSRPPARITDAPSLTRPGASALRLTVRVERAGWLILSEAYDPGWSAVADGTPLEVRPADLALIAVAVPEGRHRVELRYRPRCWRAASIATLLGLVTAAVLLASGRFPRARSGLRRWP